MYTQGAAHDRRGPQPRCCCATSFMPVGHSPSHCARAACLRIMVTSLTLHGATSTWHAMCVALHGATSTSHAMRVALHGATSTWHAMRVALHGATSTWYAMRVALHSATSMWHAMCVALHGSLRGLQYSHSHKPTLCCLKPARVWCVPYDCGWAEHISGSSSQVACFWPAQPGQTTFTTRHPPQAGQGLISHPRQARAGARGSLVIVVLTQDDSVVPDKKRGHQVVLQ